MQAIRRKRRICTGFLGKYMISLATLGLFLTLSTNLGFSSASMMIDNGGMRLRDFQTSSSELHTAGPNEKHSSLSLIGNAGTGNFTHHDPIFINDNDELIAMAQAEGWSGNGSSVNPYVIEGYIITLTDNSTNSSQLPYRGISLRDVSLHVIIRNNIVNSTVSGNYLVSGLYLENVTSVTVVNNILESSLGVGIYVVGSNQTIIMNNTFHSVSSGVRLWDSMGDVIEGNLFINSTLDVEGFSQDIVIRYNDFTDNTVAVFLSGTAGSFVRNIQILDNRFENVFQGIAFINGTDLLIQGNSFLQLKSYGVTISDVNGASAIHDRIIISKNLFVNSTSTGGTTILASALRDSIISDNVFKNNAHSSIRLDGGSVNVSIARNTFDQITGSDVIVLDASNNNIIRDNIIANFERDGIHLIRGASHNLIINNVINDSSIGEGIVIYDSSNGNQVLNNTISRMKLYGVGLDNTIRDTYVKWNDFIDNNGLPTVVDAPQASDNSPLNNNNTFILNYWSDWTTPDSDGDGIVDNPYPRIEALSLGGWKIDPLPLAKPHINPHSPPITTTFTPTLIKTSGTAISPVPFSPFFVLMLSLGLTVFFRRKNWLKK